MGDAIKADGPTSASTVVVTLRNLSLVAADRTLCALALESTGTIIEAAALLGITRHALKRRIVKHGIKWSRKAE